MKTRVFDRTIVSIVLGFAAAAALQAQTAFQQTNLVSDLPGKAAHTDSNLVNPWGIATSATSPFWVSDNGTNVSTLYNTSGTPQALVVNIPGAAGNPGQPTGQVFNPNAAGGAFNKDIFIFASQSGTIDGWRGALAGNAEILFDNSAAGAQYTGLAFGTVGGKSYLYGANFGQQQIDVFPESGAPSLTGNFTDPALPAGYSPFNIQQINGSLFAAFAQEQSGDEVKGLGLGLIDEFNLNGDFVRRFATGGLLNAPWGFSVGPASFHEFAGSLLVGNFGDGTINGFNLTTGASIGPLRDLLGNPIAIDGLWGIIPGNGGNGGTTNRLYFAAGIDDENHGLFGSLAAVPDAQTTALLFAMALVALCGFSRWFRRVAVEP
jgi:uncharacterized protein (TIGR03118 family)